MRNYHSRKTTLNFTATYMIICFVFFKLSMLISQRKEFPKLTFPRQRTDTSWNITANKAKI